MLGLYDLVFILAFLVVFIVKCMWILHHHNNNTDDDDNDNISNNNNNGNNNDNNNNNNNNREKRKTKLLSCYLKAMKELKKGYRERMHNLWNEMRMFEIEEQHLACQVRNIFQQQ